MANAFSRSWEITKLSIDVIKKDKELLLFPLMAGIFSLAFLLAILFPTLIVKVMSGAGVMGQATTYVLLFLVYLGLAFIATFFNVCVVYTTKKRFAGGNATFGESIKFAFSRIHLILSWSLLAATVGILLKYLDDLAERAGPVGGVILSILHSILGLAWAIVTIFVVPAMVYHELGPIEAIKKSAKTVKHTWGESLIRHFGIGMIKAVFIVLGIALTILLVLITAPIGGYAIGAAIVLAIVYFLVVILFFSVANTIFNTALYEYADRGKVPSGYSRDVMENAFKQKPKKGISRVRI